MDAQAAARAHRLGQKKDVYVLRLVSRDTVEEVMLKRAHRKLQFARDVLGGGEGGGRRGG